MTSLAGLTAYRTAGARRVLASMVECVLLLLPGVPLFAQADTNPSTVVVSQEPLVPGDAVRLKFWREPALSGDYLVDEAGTVVLPLLGVREVAGVSGTQLKRRLLEDYGRELAHQEVQVLLLRRVRILGAVKEPGLYHVDGTMTLGDAVALAGGATTVGKLKGIKLLRDENEIQDGLDINSLLLEQIRSGDQIMVPERSWFSRNGAVVVGALISAAGLIVGAAAF
jgi:protein involved in polysaccharide export with SLBB domain